MDESRTKNTKRNIIFSFVDTFIMMGFQFVSRSIIVYVFNSQYLGLSSLFSSILQVLNMADLGFSIAIVYNMYKPIAEHDVAAVCALLKYYRKIYHIVGVIMLGVGVAIMPLIPHLITGKWLEEINIYVVYLLYLANTVISYFLFSYKAALLNALQRLDLTKIAYSIVNILQYICQIICILVIKNFYLYIIIMVIGTALKNVLCEYISRKNYPEYECSGDINNQTKKDIILRVKGLLISNISGVTYTAFDSIILSAFLGLSTVAIYNNYIVIFNGIMNFVVLLRNAMQASVGNSVAVENREKNYKDMVLWQFFFSAIAIWCVTCMISLYQPFMKMWMGSNMLLPINDVILICLWFFISVISHAFLLYMNGNGMWWEMKWPYVLSTVYNVVMNVVLGKFYGVTGIIFSTLTASLIFGFIWQCRIVFKVYYSGISFGTYYKQQFMYLVTGIISAGLAYFVNVLISLEGILEIVVKILNSSLVFVVVFWVLYRKTNVYREARKFIKTAIRI